MNKMADLYAKEIVNELHGGSLATKRTADNIELAQAKVESLKMKLEKQAQRERTDTETAPGDWTHIYSLCDGYEDKQDLEYAVQEESKRLQELSANAMLSAHQHDHADERAMFEKPEKEKMSICERYRLLGNLLFAEGLDYLPRAAHQYQLLSSPPCHQALSYYEYCFPDNDADQQHLNRVKYACQCNISFCYYRMGYYREAITAATVAINDKEIEVNAKIYFRRAQAYRKLDEYSHAANDLKMAASLAPSDAGIAEELLELQNQIRIAAKKDKALAAAWFHSDSARSSHGHESSADIEPNGQYYRGEGGGIAKLCVSANAGIDLNREMSMLMSLNLPLEAVLSSSDLMIMQP